jgi:hypothetical protein
MPKRSLMHFVAVLSLCASGLAQGNPADVVGTWEGESICTVRPSACHDEHVIYDIKQTDHGRFSMSADKVVNGERQNMGDLECTYDGKTVSCPFAKGVWSFEVSGTKMSGTLKLTDGTLFRKVQVTKKESSPRRRRGAEKDEAKRKARSASATPPVFAS